MTKLLITLGVTIALALLWHELWLHAAIFVVGFCGGLEALRIERKSQKANRHIDLMLKSLRGLRHSHRRGL